MGEEHEQTIRTKYNYACLFANNSKKKEAKEVFLAVRDACLKNEIHNLLRSVQANLERLDKRSCLIFWLTHHSLSFL